MTNATTRWDWSPLRRELSDWRASDLTLPLWWRDDDAVRVTPELERLARMSDDLSVPVHLAIIPSAAEQSLAGFLKSGGKFRGLVHGWAHANHAPPNQRPAEFGNSRPSAEAEMKQALVCLQELLGSSVLPVFVPPWNRIADEFLPKLIAAGYKGLSSYLPRRHAESADGLLQINTHIDPINWQGGVGLTDPNALIADLVILLANRRAGSADNLEPLGLLTHHLVQSDETWEFCRALLEELLSGPTAVVGFPDT